MIFHNVEQNTEAWLMLRVGIPTASDFERILTPKKFERSRQADDYMFRKIAEWINGKPIYEEQYQSRYMEHGVEYEDKAVAAYETLMEVETAAGGFWTIDSGMAGCSPDRMVGDDGILEIKCPALSKQVKAFFLGVEADHLCQLMGQLWITGRQWVDVYSYEPRLMLPPKRVARDEKFISKLAEAVNEFIDEMLRRRADIEREAGPFLRLQAEPAPGSEVDLIANPTMITEDDLDEIIRMRREQQGAR